VCGPKELSFKALFPIRGIAQCTNIDCLLCAFHRRPARTLVVLGSGGHTTEILSLCRAMDVSRYVPATFVVADTDHLSEARAEDTLLNTAWATHRDHCRFWRVPRAREVGQSWLSTVATTALACAHAFGIITTVRPELILVNGPVRLPISLFRTQPAAVCCQLYLRVS
jgi:beta-1,4-N-acetylglucosaminyltransferase